MARIVWKCNEMKEIKLTDEYIEPTISHEEIAEWAGTKPQNVLNMIDKYEIQLTRVGAIFFKKTINKNNATERRECFLDESAASLLMTFSKNTEKVIEFKVNLILAFKKLRQLKLSTLEEKVTELELVVREVVATVNIINPRVNMLSDNIIRMADVVNQNSKALNNNVSQTNKLQTLVKKKK